MVVALLANVLVDASQAQIAARRMAAPRATVMPSARTASARQVSAKAPAKSAVRTAAALLISLSSARANVAANAAQDASQEEIAAFRMHAVVLSLPEVSQNEYTVHSKAEVPSLKLNQFNF